jgi:hypothetical protein
MPKTIAAGFPTKFATYFSNFLCNTVVPDGKFTLVKSLRQVTEKDTHTQGILQNNNPPPSTWLLQVLCEYFFNDSITRGVQYSSDAAKPR